MLLPIANILQPLIDFSELIIKFWHNTVGLSWGWSIVALTCTVRALILPLTFKQVRSMQDLQRLQPEIKRLQERYKDDKQRMNQEMMKFYQEHKVNPLGSCLPLILQLPFFLSLYQLLNSKDFVDDVGKAKSFLFIPDLTSAATGGVLVVLIVLYVATQLAASAVTAFSADKNQRRLMFALPFFFVVFMITYGFKAGLLVYWITTNFWTFGQQVAVKKLFPKPEPIEPSADLGPGGARGKPPVPLPAGAAAVPDDAGGGGFMGRIRAAMDQAQAGASDRNGSEAKTSAKASNGSKGESKPKPKSGNGAPPRTSAPPPSPRKKKKRARRR